MKRIRLFVLMLAVILSVLSALSINIIPRNEVKDRTRCEKSPVKVVETFWQLSETGKLTEAHELTTQTHNGLTIIVKNKRAWEKLIYNKGLSFVEIIEEKEINSDEWEIAVKVRGKNGYEFNLFHTLVRQDDEWKIFTISY